MVELQLRLDVTQIFCDVDDFYQQWELLWQQQHQLPSMPQKKRSSSRLSPSEVVTIVIAFHGSGFWRFKQFYTLCVLPHWRKAFPKLVSSSRFVELMPWGLMLLLSYLLTRRGKLTGTYFIDSTPIAVSQVKRSRSHKVFEGYAAFGKNSVGWYFGFKLHLVINEKGELIGFLVTPANLDDCKPVMQLTKNLTGKVFGDRGYSSQALFQELFQQGLQLITKLKKNQKNKLVSLMDKILLRKRALIESVNDYLKNICQIEHSRHRSHFNFLVNLLAALVAYTYLDNKPSLNLETKGLPALPSGCF